LRQHLALLQHPRCAQQENPGFVTSVCTETGESCLNTDDSALSELGSP